MSKPWEHYDFSLRKRQKGTGLGRVSIQWPPCHLASQTWEYIFSEGLSVLSTVLVFGPALDSAGLRTMVVSTKPLKQWG